MDKTVVIHQPDFLPYLGFFHRLINCDLFIILDHVQFVHKGGWTHRDKIKTSNGAKWITIPIIHTGNYKNINEVLIDNSKKWQADHLNILKENYSSSEFFSHIHNSTLQIYNYECKRLVDFNINAFNIIFKLLNINIPYILSSTLNPFGSKNEMLIDLLLKTNANIYLTGTGSKAYLNEDNFVIKKINVIWQNYHQPIYKQLFGDFIPYLSIIDLLYNCGIEESNKILRSC